MSTTSSSRRPSLPSSPTFPVTQTQQARDRERFIDGQRHTEGLEKVAAKRRARTLLRDYYGLAAKAGEGSREEREKEMGMNIDSAHFNPAAHHERLINSQSLPALLKRGNDLATEIRELDGERQSLVYNHHHELIEASDTIRKMKSRAESLDQSLDQLQASFSSISQLASSLSTSIPPSSRISSSRREASTPAPSAEASTIPRPPLRSRRTGTSPLSSPSTPVDERGPNQRPGLDNRRRSSVFSTGHPDTRAQQLEPSEVDELTFDPLTHLPPILGLPTVLRELLGVPYSEVVETNAATGAGTAMKTGDSDNEKVQAEKRERANRLWGSWEPALRSWEEAGIKGVREIGDECREVLRTSSLNAKRERRASASNGNVVS